MSSLKNLIEATQQEFQNQLKTATTIKELETIKIAYLGRQGIVQTLMEQLKQLTVEEKRICGPLLNTLKQECSHALSSKEQTLLQAQALQKLKKEQYFDVTAYQPTMVRGSLHPLTLLVQDLENIFISMGYIIADGPEVETEFYNFEALNIPKNHPARDMWDTFYLDIPGMVLRTHTSPVQIHALEQYGAPLAVVGLGKCYRHEATDASHDFLFMQAEGLFISKKVSMSNLLATIQQFLRTLFGKEELTIQVRPSYFPFVEPGIEVDMSCPFCTEGCSTCKKTKWIELGGAGLVHPHVLKSCSLDPLVYSGFAFGFGLTRLAMLKYGISDIRLLHSSRIDFLEQF